MYYLRNTRCKKTKTTYILTLGQARRYQRLATPRGPREADQALWSPRTPCEMQSTGPETPRTS